jgi:hypothetical protein
MRRKTAYKLKQPTPQELLDGLLDFLSRKFYQNHPLQFAKDRPRLLDWVVLWPARWFDERGVTIPATEYRKIFESVFMQALVFGKAEKITYFPAYLAKVIQSHFAMHGEEYYESAKSMRNQVDHALLIAGSARHAAPDPVRELAQAARLVKPKKLPRKPPVNAQLTLL